MHMEDLAQPPLETSLMGVVRGVVDHYGIRASTPWIYGASGHAFVVNVHPQLCPSSPYCWNGEGFVRLLANVGVQRRDFGFFEAGSSAEERAAVEATVREHLDRGVVCSMMNMDNQLITGHDEHGFQAAEPWCKLALTPPRLTYGSWAEFGDEVHACFYAYERSTPVDAKRAVGESLAYAAALYAEPTAHTFEPYGMGPDAYRNWTAALDAGHGGTHGAWWNATVWSECRKMAGAYFKEIAERFPETADPSRDLARRYLAIGASLEEASNKEMPAEEKAELVKRTAALEREAVDRIPALIAALD